MIPQNHPLDSLKTHYYKEFSTPIDPSNFAVPAACADQGGGQKPQPKKKPLRFSLP
jgi:hypothetical protein